MDKDIQAPAFSQSLQTKLQSPQFKPSSQLDLSLQALQGSDDSESNMKLFSS